MSVDLQLQQLRKMRPNQRFEGTAEKLRFSVPRRLRRRAAPQA